MTTLEVKLPKRHTAQKQVVKESRRFNVMACGRRFGKTTLLLDVLVTEPKGALDGYPVAWFAPTYKMMEDVWRDALGLLQPIIKRPDAQQKRLELVTGGILDMWSLDNTDAGRGRKYSKVAIDEAAMVRYLRDAWQQAIRPTLTDLEGDAWFASTPKGFNFFRSLYAQGQDPLQTDWNSWQLPSSANPHMPAREIEAARLGLPERVFAQEYLAHFLEDGGGVFRGVSNVTTLEPQEPKPSAEYVMGADWGKLNDFTVLSIFDVKAKEQVFLDRFNRIDYEFQHKRLLSAYEKYKPKTIVAETNSMGEPIIDRLRRERLPIHGFTTTNASKAEAIETLSLMIERQEIKLLNDSVQTSELQAYESERLPSGLMRYGAPEGMHDDTVMAAALAVTAMSRPERAPSRGSFSSPGISY